MSLTAIAWPAPGLRCQRRFADPALARPEQWPQHGQASASPARALPGDDLTRMVQVERDGNPLRRLGLTSPWLGKLADVDLGALELLAVRAAAALDCPPLWKRSSSGGGQGAPGPQASDRGLAPARWLVVGLAESSLMLAWWLHRRLPEATLALSSRRALGLPGERRFVEPHSHGPEHHLALPDDTIFDRVVIVEDEITTGQTLLNLVRALAPRARRFEVVAIADLRAPALRRGLEATLAAEGLCARVIDLTSRAPAHATLWYAPSVHGAQDGRSSAAPGPPESTAEWAPAPAPEWPDEVPCGVPGDLPRRWLPAATHARCRADLAQLLDRARSQPFTTLYSVGEAIDLPLSLLSALPAAARPGLRHVTRSPWRVDGRAVRTRLDLGPDACGTPHFLYNLAPPPGPGRAALLVGDRVAAPVLAQLAGHLRRQGVEPVVFESADPA